MNRNFSIGILILCFSLSSVHVSLAVQAVGISPVIVQPYEIQELNQQMLDRDRQNRDEEIAIQNLIEENNKLTQDTLAHQEDEGLKKINQTMLSYRNALYARDQARIMANSERWPSRYGDLIALTEDADAMTENRRLLERKSGLLAEKYQMLTVLKDEMIVLNEKLKVRGADQREKIIEGYKEITRQQQDKLKMLVERLDEMDKKISHFDEIIAQKDRQIAQLNESVRWLNQVLAAAKNKAEYYRLTSQRDQTTVRQVQEQVDLLKSELENKIKDLKGVMIDGQLRAADLQSRMEELRNELDQKEQQVALLNTELKNRIAREKNQSVLEYQIQDLKTQLQDLENRIATLKAKIQSGQKTQVQADTLRQQLADQQNKVGLLKQELDSKTVQYNQMTLMISDYQKKLESKDNAYNEQLRQVLLSKNGQAQIQGQIAGLSARLQEKEAELVKIKKDMYDLKGLTAAKDRDAQAKNLSLSMELTNLRSELASARRQLSGTPGSDEIDFLKTGLKVAAAQLKQKDEMLSKIKADADEYASKFKEQSREFQSLKEQLQNAYEEIKHKNGDLKFRDLELAHLKDHSSLRIKDLQEKLKQALNKSVKLVTKTNDNNVNELSQCDRLREKLKQALDEIDQQGRVVNLLVDKLHGAGQSVDLSHYFVKP